MYVRMYTIIKFLHTYMYVHGYYVYILYMVYAQSFNSLHVKAYIGLLTNACDAKEKLVCVHTQVHIWVKLTFHMYHITQMSKG